jgi:hypothetical protein
MRKQSADSNVPPPAEVVERLLHAIAFIIPSADEGAVEHQYFSIVDHDRLGRRVSLDARAWTTIFDRRDAA